MNSEERYNSPIFAYQYEYIKGKKSNNGDIEYYLEQLKVVKGTVLEIGCGTGRITIPLHKQGCNITGIDLAEEMVLLAKKKANQESLEIPFFVSDALKFESQEQFESIIIPFNAICFIPNNLLSGLMANIKKLLSEKGKVYIDFTRPESGVYSNSTPVEERWSEDLFIEELKLSVRWRMRAEPLNVTNEVKYTYDWVVKGEGDSEEEVSSNMLFSSYSLEKYQGFFKEIGLDLQNLVSKDFVTFETPYKHYFCVFG